MHIRKRAAAAVAALSTAALTAGGLAVAGGAGASSAGGVPVIVAHVSSSSISLSTGTRIHAGRVAFRVVSAQGLHGLQVVRLHSGYTFAEAIADVNKAFTGDVAAVRRVDANITFRGGADATPQRPATFGITLSSGHYMLIDQDSNAHATLTVLGSIPARVRIPHQSTITVFTYGFDQMPASLPASGWTRIVNRSDQPHFVAMNRVKADTTYVMVRDFFKSGGQSAPTFALHANASSGVISPNWGETLRYNLPAGKYLIACYWPDDDTGMPHAFMGMWKLIWLK